MCGATLSGGLKGPTSRHTRVEDAARGRSAEPSIWDREIAGPPARSGAMVLLAVALCVVGLGLYLVAPGFGVLFLIVIAPALIATFVSLDRRGKDTSESTFGESIAFLLGKLFKTVAILFLVIFGIVIAAGVFCFVLFASNSIGH
jgi:hypothetical protein